MPAASDAETPWGGAYWLPGSQNWGALPGINIAPGATRLTFYAAGAKGGEVVKFVAGGVVGSAGLACADSLSAVMQVTLTTTMTKYVLPFNGGTYHGVWGGFAWTAEAQLFRGDAGGPVFSLDAVTFFVDDIQWEM
jgi:hypothetical protein